MLTCQKHLFDLADDVTYLNMAYMSPLMKQSMEIGVQGLKMKSRPYEIQVDDFFTPVEKVKASFSRLVEGDDPHKIAIIPSISYAMANAARNIPLIKGEEIIVLEGQFPSHVYPWKALADDKGGKIITIKAPDSENSRGSDWTLRILESIGSETKIVAIPHVHWSDGTLYDLRNIREKLDQYGGYLIIDGTQSIGAFPFSIKEIRPDVLAVSSYKWLLGPYGIGLSYYSERFSNGSPIENSWLNRLNSDDFARLVDYQDEYRSGAYRYSVGESSNFLAIPMMDSGIQQILKWGVDSIQEYGHHILGKDLEELNAHGFKTAPPGERGNHLFGIGIPDHIPPKKLAAFLMEKNIYISVRGSYIRVSPYVYNTAEDISRLKDALIEASGIL